MADAVEAKCLEPSEVYAAGRRYLAIQDFDNAVSTLGSACELLATKHGEQADECAEAYLWYGKALLALARREIGVLSNRVPQGDAEEKESDEDPEDNEEANGDESESGENNEAESEDKDTKTEEKEKIDNKADASKEAGSSNDQCGTSHGEENGDDSAADLGDEDDVDNLQIAWEMLDLSRSILEKRLARDQLDATRSLLADVHLTLGEVALESETFDKAVIDMQNCLEIQKQLYKSDDRRIAETHFEIGLANSLSSNFEEAITHFKNAINILETRIKNLESPLSSEDSTVKKHSTADPHYSVEAEIKELKGLLPEIQEKLQDMAEYKAETMRKLREQLCNTNGSSNGQSSSGSEAASQKKASDISHLIKRKRQPDEEDGGSAAKNART